MTDAEIIRDYLMDPMMHPGPDKSLAALAAIEARVAELEGQVARAHRVEKRLRAYLLRIEKLATESHTEDPDN